MNHGRSMQMGAQNERNWGSRGAPRGSWGAQGGGGAGFDRRGGGHQGSQGYGGGNQSRGGGGQWGGRGGSNQGLYFYLIMYYNLARFLIFSWVNSLWQTPSKGQLISKCPFGFIVWTKIPTKLFWISALSFFVASWGLHGSSLGFLGT